MRQPNTSLVQTRAAQQIDRRQRALAGEKGDQVIRRQSRHGRARALGGTGDMRGLNHTGFGGG